MTNDFNLRLIRAKIYEIHRAIMYNLSDEVVRLPNNIVRVVKVDDEGQLWFMCDKPAYRLEQYSEWFPVRLHFYRKGKLFHIEIGGLAELDHDLLHENEVLGNRMLIKMKMKTITYTETHKKTSIDAMQWLNKVTSFLSSHLSIPRHTSPLHGH